MNAFRNLSAVLFVIVAIAFASTTAAAPAAQPVMADYALSEHGVVDGAALVVRQYVPEPTGSTRVDACRTYHVFAHQGGVDEVDALFCGTTITAKVEKTETTETVVIVIDDGGVQVDQPDEPKVDEPKTDDKVKCDHGNGNGPSGCNNNEHGNQDETKEKGDKASDVVVEGVEIKNKDKK